MFDGCMTFCSFKEVYERNSRNATSKCLRCFPQCTPHGHMYHAFCGTSIETELTFSLDNNSHNECASDSYWEKVLVIGEFRTEDSVGLSSLPFIDKDLILSNIRRPGKMWLPYVLGEVKHVEFAFNINEPSRKIFKLEFNRNLHPWINLWKCVRGVVTLHVFEVVILQDHGDVYQPIAAYSSPSFRITSPKKQPTSHDESTASAKLSTRLDLGTMEKKRSRSVSTTDDTDSEQSDHSPRYVSYNDIAKPCREYKCRATVKLETNLVDTVVEY